MIKLSNQGRIRLLTTASATVAAIALTVPALAGETIVTPNAGPPPLATTTVDAHAIINEAQENANAVNAAITNSGIFTSESGDVDTSTTSITVSSNSMLADANGNDFDNAIDLSALPVGVNLGIGDGAASLGLQVNLGPVTSSVGNNGIVSDNLNYSSGSLVTSNNTIASSTSGNTGTTLLDGPIRPEFASAATGSSTQNTVGSPDWLDATGTLLASTLQIQSDAGGLGAIINTATATDNRILLNVINTGIDQEVIASPELDDNTISATVAGNTSDSTIDIEGGPTFAGTAVVTNGQINVADDSASVISAFNENSQIVATIAAQNVGTGDDAELQGALSVAGNAITSAAAGNQAVGAAGQAGNRILLADGMAFIGNGTLDPGTDSVYDAGDASSAVAADLIINNSQGNAADAGSPLAITATTDDGAIAGIVDDILNGAVTVQDNAITASASGNVASSALATGAGSPSFEGSAALANQQTNFYVNVAARSTGDIYAAVTDDDDLTGSSVLVDGNTVGATAYGSSVSQNLAVSAVQQVLPVSGALLSGGTNDPVTADGNAHADGSLTVTNLQAAYNVDVDAEEVHNIYAASALGETVEDSSVDVTDNVAEAVSVGNGASNALALTGTGVGTGAGIVSVQINDDDDDDAPDDADGTATSEGVVQANVGGVDGAGVTVSGNLQRAVAYGGSATNALSVGAAGTLTVDGALSEVSSSVTNVSGSLTSAPQPEVNAAYGVLNVQSLNGQLVATASGPTWADDSSFRITVANSVEEGTITNGGHLEDGVLVDGELRDDVPVGGNLLVAAAYGADAKNSGTMNIGNLVSDGGDFVGVLSVTNVQETSDLSSVSATAGGAQAVLTTVEGSVTGSGVSTSYNAVQALAVANRADNDVDVNANNIDTEADFFGVGIVGFAEVDGGTATTDASFGINNVQSAGGAISASLLMDDAAVSIITTIGGDVTNSSVSSDGNLLNAGATANRADNAVTVDGNNLATTAALTNYQSLAPAATVSASIGISGTGDDENIGGVIVQLGSTIDPSSVTVNGNTISGSVTGNSATNLASLSGTNVEDGSDHLLTYAISDASDVLAAADVTAANLQVVGDDATFTSNVFGTFAIDTEEDIILASALSVDDNQQSSSAVANTAETTVKLLATNTAAGASLASSQISEALSVSATSNVDIFAPVVSEASSVSISGNDNLALAVQNNAVNKLTVDTTNANPVFNAIDGLAAVGDIFGVSAWGDHVLLNQQSAVGTTSATAVTNIYNDDWDDAETTGLVDGSVTVAGNVTTAEASANRAVNIANVGADATLAASAAVTNAQSNSGNVTASAMTFASVNIAGDDVPNASAVTGSAVLVGDNTTTALARGNSASNVLNYVAGAAYAAGTGDAANSSIDVAGPFGPDVFATSNAQAAVLNVQVNTGEVLATSTQTSYLVALNGPGGVPTLTSATIGVIGNAMSAAAYGNTAANEVNLAARNTNQASASVANYQYNGGPVSATVTSVNYGTTHGIGAVTGSALSVTGNSITATAVGNSAVNTITAGM
jgi:hypothetical protein